MSKALVAIDVSAIKDYVFATDRLKEIRGASALLDELNREGFRQAAVEVDPGAEGFARGGGGLLRVEASLAEDVCAAISGRCRSVAEAVDVRFAVIRQDEDGAPSRFQEQHLLLGARLRQDKAEVPEVLDGPTHPFLRTCEACGRLYACRRRDDGRRLLEDKKAQRLLCLACDAKLAKDDDVTEALAGLAPGRWPGFWGRLGLSGGRRPQKIEDLVREVDGDRPLALLYADGDAMGRILEGASSLEEAGEWSKAIEDSLLEALHEAIAGPLDPGGREMFPFDIFLLGGDDLVLATTADRAMETALTLLTGFSRAAKNSLPAAASLSVGLAVAHAKFPVRYLVDLAEGALKHAKRGRFAAQRRGACSAGAPGFVSYVVVTSSSHADFESFERKELHATPDGEREIQRTLRPYSPETLKAIRVVAAMVRSLPRTKLEALRATAFMGYRDAILEGRVIFSRLRAGNEENRRGNRKREGDGRDGRRSEREIVREAMDKLAAGRHTEFPWIFDGRVACNPWADITDLLDLGVSSREALVDDRASAPDEED